VEKRRFDLVIPILIRREGVALFLDPPSALVVNPFLSQHPNTLIPPLSTDDAPNRPHLRAHMQALLRHPHRRCLPVIRLNHSKDTHLFAFAEPALHHPVILPLRETVSTYFIPPPL